MKKKSKNKKWRYKNARKWQLHGLKTGSKCTECNEPIFYFSRYDSNSCIKCNIWKDSKCRDTNCEFCANRPDFPNMVLNEDNRLFDKKVFFVYKYTHRLKRQTRRRLKHKLKDY